MTSPDALRATQEPAGGTEAAFFDLDNTIIAKAAMSAFRRPLYAGGLINRRSLTRALFAQLVYLHLGSGEHRLRRVRESILRITRGWRRDDVVAIIEEALDEVVEPIIYAEAMDLIDLHHAKGRRVIIVSASPEEIVLPLARHLGITEVIASRAEVDEEGRYTGDMDFYAFGPFKAQAMRRLAAEEPLIDLDKSFAYSDSINDVAMLEAVGHAVAVNPDRVLAKLAKEKAWDIRHFTRPVRLRDRVRDRVPVPVANHPKIVVSATAAVAITSVSAAAWWYTARRLSRLSSSGKSFRRR